MLPLLKSSFSLPKIYQKDNKRGLKQSHGRCISWSVYNLKGSHPKHNEAMQSPNNLEICHRGWQAPGYSKGKVKCVTSRNVNI